MKVLFIASGNKQDKPGAVVQNQAETLINGGVEVEFYLIRGKGLKGYLKNIYPLYKHLKNTDVDVIHSHYSLSAIVTSIALLFFRSRPHVVSLMGSDTRLVFPYREFVKFFSRFFWKATIVKSLEMKSYMDLKRCIVLPNGVDLVKIDAIKNRWNSSNTLESGIGNILFISDPNRKEKNYLLAEKAVESISGNLQVIYNKSHKFVIESLFKADVLLLTSFYEGSPNIIKEAMACNCPIVATDVGDIRWLFGEVPGHYICSFDSKDVAEKIQQALIFRNEHKQTNGRKRILELGLDAESVSNKLIKLYQSAI